MTAPDAARAGVDPRPDAQQPQTGSPQDTRGNADAGASQASQGSNRAGAPGIEPDGRSVDELLAEWVSVRRSADARDKEATAHIEDELRRHGISNPEAESEKRRRRAQGTKAKSTDMQTTRRAVSVRASDVKAEKVEWLWRCYLPAGKLVVLDGHPGTGKSTLTLDVAAKLSSGAAMHGDRETRAPRAVLIINAEDSPADTMRPRLKLAGANLRHCYFLREVEDSETREKEPFDLSRHLETLERCIRESKVALVIIDPLTAYLGTVNAYKDQEVRGVLAPLATLAEDRRCTILLVRHLNKGTGTNAVLRGGGSIGIIAAARTGLLLAKDPEDPAKRVLAVAKANVGRGAPSLIFHIESEKGADHGRIVWEGTSPHTAASLLAEAPDADSRALEDQVADSVRNALRDGPVPAKQVRSAISDDGLSPGKGTVERAAKKLGVIKRREGFGPGSLIVWELPPIGPTSPAGAESSLNGAYAGDGSDQALSSASSETPPHRPHSRVNGAYVLPRTSERRAVEAP